MSKRLFVFMVISALGIATGVYGADNATENNIPEEAAMTPTVADKIASLNGKQLVELGDEKLKASQNVKKRVSKKLDGAYVSKDTVLVKELDEIVAQINSSLGNMESRNHDLKINVGANNLTGARQDARIIVTEAETIQGLGARADNMVGVSDVVLEGGTKTEVYVDPDEAEDVTDKKDDIGPNFSEVAKTKVTTASPYK